MNNILAAIGEALIDFIPDKSGCAFGDVTAFAPKVGGAPANVCAAFARLGGKSRILTQLGDDPFGHKIINELNDVGVDTGCITLTDKANTALAFVSLGENGDRTLSFYRKPSADMLYEAHHNLIRGTEASRTPVWDHSFQEPRYDTSQSCPSSVPEL